MEPKRNLMKTLGIACAIIVVLGGSVWYAKADIDGKFAAIRQTRADIQSKERALSALASLQGDAEKAGQYLPQIDRMLTTKDQLLGFTSDVGLLARQAGFTGAPKFKDETGPQTGDLQKARFSLGLEGSKDIADLAMFFLLVDRSKYYVRFESVDASREGSRLKVTLDGYVIYF